MKAGIVLDDYKLPIFKEVLDRENFKYTQHPGVTEGTITLLVETEFVSDLQPFVEEANTRATK